MSSSSQSNSFQHAGRHTNSAARVPLRLGFTYLGITLALFFFGPLDWPITDYLPIIGYLSLILLTIYAGYNLGLRTTPVSSAIPRVKSVYVIGGLAAIILLFPSSQIYTGRWPWQVLSALGDQRDAYLRLREQLEITTGSRAYLALTRAIFAPLVFAVLPLGIVYWKSLSFKFKIILILTVISSAIFSSLRGTTRELVDIVVVGGSAFLVSMVRAQHGRLDILRHWKKIFLVIVLGFGVVTALVVRTQARLGDSAVTVCIGGGTVCPAFQSPFYKSMNEDALLALSTVTGYLSQGYYGLNLALQKPFDPTYGVGHSAALMSLYQSTTNDYSLVKRTYIDRLNDDNWSDQYQWSTLLVWLANDVSFAGVPFIIFFLGFLWAKSWIDAAMASNDVALIVFCILSLAIFYLPANNQLGATFDAYATLVGWVLLWLLMRGQSIRNRSG